MTGDHASHPWRHPRRGASWKHNSLVRRNLINRRGRRARKLARQRYRNAIKRGLPALLPKYMRRYYVQNT